jgi:hypothetical protein
MIATIVHGELLGWLKDCEYDGSDEIIIHSGLDLAGDFSKLLLWDCYPELLSKPIDSAKPPLAALAEFVQERDSRLFLLFRSIVNKLFQFLYTAN